MTSRLRWGLIGCGDIARRRVAPALRDLPDCDLIAVSRAKADLAKSFANEFGAKKWHSNWQDVVVDPEVDAVYIATPVDLHAAQTILAAEHGKHVLCEKPMALDPGECDRMIAACKTNNVTLGIAYYRRFYPVVARIKEIIQEGGIGKPFVSQVFAFERFNPDPSHPRYWLIKKERSGGGPMFDFGCHRVEVLLNLLGPIRETRGRNWNALFDREVEDSSAALFEFESGARGLLTVTHAAIEPQDTLDIFGSDGSVHVRVLNEGTLEVRTSDGVRRESHPTRENTHQPLIDDFSRAVLEGRVPAVTGDVGLEVARVIEDIYENPRGTGGPRA